MDALPTAWLSDGDLAFPGGDRLLSVLRLRSRELRLPQQLHEHSHRGRAARACSQLCEIAGLFLV